MLGHNLAHFKVASSHCIPQILYFYASVLSITVFVVSFQVLSGHSNSLHGICAVSKGISRNVWRLELNFVLLRVVAVFLSTRLVDELTFGLWSVVYTRRSKLDAGNASVIFNLFQLRQVLANSALSPVFFKLALHRLSTWLSVLHVLVGVVSSKCEVWLWKPFSLVQCLFYLFQLCIFWCFGCNEVLFIARLSRTVFKSKLKVSCLQVFS